jgi:hypothetical protein
MYFHFWKYLQFFFSCFKRGRHPEIHKISLGNTRKYQEVPKNFRKNLKISGNTCTFQEILGNIRKYYEIPGNSRPKTWNATIYFVKNMKYFGIFTRLLFDLSFTILLFLLGYMKCQTGNTMTVMFKLTTV